MAHLLLIYPGQRHIGGLSLLNQWEGDWKTVGMELEDVLYKIRDGILHLTLNRPEVRNVLTPEIWGDINAAVQRAREDDQVRVVIVTGVGEKALASGADIREIRDRDYLKMLLGAASAVLENLEDLYKPVICAINGYALGGSCELAMACDIRIATRRSRLGQPEVGLSIIPGAGEAQGLSRLVGLGKAKELIYTGKIITAEEAGAISLINQVTEDDQDALMTAAEEMARQIMAKGPVAITVAKMAINLGYKTDINIGLVIERLAQTIAFSTEDRKEGIAAFLKERPAQFEGR